MPDMSVRNKNLHNTKINIVVYNDYVDFVVLFCINDSAY